MKYIVLKLNEDDQSESLIEFLKNQWLLTEEGIGALSKTELTGVFKGPTTFCNNSDGHRGKKTEAGWTRGKKYGWWVCGKCKKPTERWSNNLNAVLSSARNLLT